MILNVILLIVYAISGIGAYKIQYEQGSGRTFSVFTGLFWPIPVTIIYVMAGLGSVKVLETVKNAVHNIKGGKQ